MLNDTHVCLSQTLQRLKMTDAIYAVRESLWASSIYTVYERLAALNAWINAGWTAHFSSYEYNNFYP